MSATLEPTDSTVYTDEELAQIDLCSVPKHVAIIMDGNRRWAKKKGLPIAMGHWQGAETLSDVLRASTKIGVKTLTVYVFSTENWHRPRREVEDLMHIFYLYLKRKKEVMIRNGIRLNAIGDLSKLHENVRNAFFEIKNATQRCDRINLVLALNYGARDEIRRAIVKIVKKKIPPNQITEECIAEHLDTQLFGDPALLIRTGGEMRISNFLLWQVSYTEFFSTKMLWPNFSPKEFLKAILSFQKRSRRLGE